jgi:hypothetical protein
MTSLAALLVAGISGCGEARRAIAAYPVVESPDVAEAPYPSLLDMPSPQEAAASAPDPLEGAVAAADLQGRAADQRAEAARVGAPVLDVQPLRDDADAVRRGR